MRMMPVGMLALKNRKGTALLAKGRPAAKVAHFSAPLKGMSRFAELNEADPLLASILTNWVVEDDRITVRPGYVQIGAIAAATPISTIIPYYGAPSKLAFASGGKIYDMGGVELTAGMGQRRLGVGVLQRSFRYRLHHHRQRRRWRLFVGRHHLRR